MAIAPLTTPVEICRSVDNILLAPLLPSFNNLNSSCYGSPNKFEKLTLEFFSYYLDAIKKLSKLGDDLDLAGLEYKALCKVNLVNYYTILYFSIVKTFFEIELVKLYSSLQYLDTVDYANEIYVKNKMDSLLECIRCQNIDIKGAVDIIEKYNLKFRDPLDQIETYQTAFTVNSSQL